MSDWTKLGRVRKDDRAGPPQAAGALPVAALGNAYAQAALDGEVEAVLAEPEGSRNARLYKAALKIGTLVGSGELDEAAAAAVLYQAGVETGLEVGETRGTIRSGLKSGKQHPRPPRPAAPPKRTTNGHRAAPSPRRAEATGEDQREVGSSNHDRTRLEDAHVAETVANRALRGRFCWARGLDWLHYSGGCWKETAEATVAEQVRRHLIDQCAAEAKAGATADRRRDLDRLLSASRIRAVVSLAKGILEVDATAFDQHPDLLNVGNGVVDLATGILSDHSPALLLTKITKVDYYPDASSADWTEALRAVPDPVAAYLRVRVGQAATGHPTPDDIMPVLQGGGSNGKTTVVGAITKALGAYAVIVPERLLMANPSDHPTELMTLRGARFAVIEETPEARHLSVKRLKDTVGTPTMTARLIGRNNVTWDVTHSLFLTTNYRPRVDETDHGTWRRLALIRFPYTFTAPSETSSSANARPGTPGLRERLRDGRQGQHEAVLAWIVAGARWWFAHDRVMPPVPPVVRADTAIWRGEADLICGYISDRLSFDQDYQIATVDMYEDFSRWLTGHGHKPWADQTLTARFAQHGMVEAANVEKKRVKASDAGTLSRADWDLRTWAASARCMAWLGVRFRRSDDADELEGQFAVDQANQATLPGVPGVLR